MSFFREVSRPEPFEDKFEKGGFEFPVDVIIPILHSTPFWEQNLKSYYREIPINRLIIGDAGAIDGSVEIAKTFPRVEVLNHSEVKTLAKSLSFLISEVQTDYFVYLQSDTLLPNGWFESMWSMRNEFDWFGCPERSVLALTGPVNDYSGKRPLAGTQFGRTAAFEGLESAIQDDFGYRQEDFILEQFVRDRGFRSGANNEVFHFHQISDRVTTGRKLELESFKLTFASDDDESRVVETQIWGLIKYCKPNNEMALRFTEVELRHLFQNRLISPAVLVEFSKKHCEEWVTIIESIALRERLMVWLGYRALVKLGKRILLRVGIL